MTSLTNCYRHLVIVYWMLKLLLDVVVLKVFARLQSIAYLLLCVRRLLKTKSALNMIRSETSNYA